MAPTGSSVRLVLSSLFFGIGWFALSFTFPLQAVRFGFNYSFTGLVGLIGSLPFVIAATIYLRSTDRMIATGIRAPPLILFTLSIVFQFLDRANFIPLVVVSSVAQAFWWVSIEVSLGSMEASGSAEKYSAAWGVPNAAVPLVAGYIIQYTGFRYMYLAGTAAFLVSFLTLPRPAHVPPGRSKSNPKARYIVPLAFAGLASGFLYYVFVPYLRLSHFSYGTIGLLVGIYGISSATGYVALVFVRGSSERAYAALSSALVSSVSVLFATRDVFAILLALIITGFGASFAMSKILAYISERTTPRLGVFYYETFFGIGFVTGAFGMGSMLQFAGILPVVLSLLSPLIYVVLLFALS
ncbi:hypothetical protein GCM10007108_15080 [Thermogymnomonas acidicola]|uniref:MFS transporter n=1 Tax=Thermogymnomonas acidicola TaxID=399579 RepID=A0AA37BTY1_9ARCH|nr:hypothetical protein GCM10007108_15080 [Thermogymnomonas acidicola]